MHISHLDTSITEETLYSLFSQYGELIAAPSFSNDSTNTNGAVIIHNSKLDPDSDSGKSSYTCSYATITFMCRENAEEARIALNGTILGSKTIRVEWNRKKQINKLFGGVIESKDHSNVISIYVQFESIDINAVKVNEAFLMQVFESFGGVTDCYIKSNNFSEDGRKQFGYAFIHFENNVYGQQCARTAAKIVGTSGRFLFNGVTLRSEVSRNFMKSTGENLIDNYEKGNKVISELSVDINRNTYQEYDQYFSQQQQQQQPQQHHQQFPPKKQPQQQQMMFENNNYNMMNMMMYSETGMSTTNTCFYSTVVDMMGNQYLIPVQMPVPTVTPRIWPSHEISSPYVYQSTIQLQQTPPISQVDYKNITNINPNMMLSSIPSQLDPTMISPYAFDNEQ